ncbi:MAG: adenylate/guanylate cyclase domain-containing protein [Planctomycetaceae bacterium]|nr:adenylate/guanylate cyclase domain-containing protein [Planctomycetaceae bacterium]
MSAADGTSEPPHEIQEPTAQQFAFLFCDLVNSTGIKAQLNSWKYVCNVLDPHDAMFRKLLAEYPRAYEIKHLGDGFLAIFGDIRDAVCCALRFHAALQSYPWQLDAPDQHVQTRIGIDIGLAVVKSQGDVPVDVFGPNVDVASRVMSAGDGGRTLMTLTAYEVARQALAFIDMNLQRAGVMQTPVQLVRHGEYRIQGVSENVVLCEACLSDLLPRPPKSSPPKVINVADQWWSPEPVPGELNPSDVPDRPGWKLIQKLGEGGFGAAYLGQDCDDPGNQRVFKFCRSPERLESFQNELQLLKRIKHLKRDDIVPYLAAHLERPPYFLEFDYVSGGNLLEWAKRQGGLEQIPFAVRLELIAKIASGVAAAHREGVFHLDLKPSNILMQPLADGTWQPRITDFGIGAIEVDGHSSRTPISPSHSSRDNSGRNVTHLYVAPESIDPLPVGSSGEFLAAAALDVRDIYALGVLLFQFAVGDLQRPLAPSAVRQVAPVLLRRDIEEATHFDPRQRLASAAELERRVRHWKSRERRRFLIRSLVPTVAVLLLIALAATAASAVVYGLYSATLTAKLEAEAAKEQAEAARREVERQYQEKLKAITGFWRDIDGDDDLSLEGEFQNEARQAQLLREIRSWLLEQAQRDLAELQPSSDNLDNQLTYARLTLRISQLLDDEQLDVREARLNAGLKAMAAAARSHADHPGVRLLLSDFENQLGQAAHERGDIPEALRRFETCLDLRRQLLADSRTAREPYPLPQWEYERKSLGIQHNLALVRLNEATRVVQDGRKSDQSLTAESEMHAAVLLLQQSLDGRTRLAASLQPPPTILLSDLGSSQFTFGRLFRLRSDEELALGRAKESGEWSQLAREYYTTALQTFLQAQQREAGPVTRQRVVETLRELVDLELELGNFAVAAEHRGAMVEQVAQVLPSAVRDLHARVYFSDAKYALSRYRTGQRPEDLPQAMAALRLAEQLYSTLVRLDPASIRLLGDLGVVQRDLGELLRESTAANDRQEGLNKLRAAIQAWEIIQERAPEHFQRHFESACEAAKAACHTARDARPPTDS